VRRRDSSSHFARFSAVTAANSAGQCAVEIGMGERVLITTFVVIVIGGVGSVRGALLAPFSSA
jgi:branched-subunit amino acid ABC-type transport system permease component